MTSSDSDVPTLAPREHIAFLPVPIAGTSPATQPLFALARSQQAAGRTDAALATYARLLNDESWVADTPIPIAARYARCRIFENASDPTDLRDEARLLRTELEDGRWPVVASVYWLYHDDAVRWSGDRPGARPPRELLATAVEAVWADWRTGLSPLRAPKGRAPLTASDKTFVVTWRRTQDRIRALIVPDSFIEREWMAPARAVARTHQVSMSPAPSDRLEPGSIQVVRPAAQTGLPWTVAINADGSTQRAEFESRRRLLIAGFLLLVTMALTAGVVTVRGVAKQLAVARLQSEFVATVSHEFRTPLTTLRQFTDRLRDRPQLTDTDRAVCYNAQSRATDRLTRLVESLLDFGRIEAGARPYDLRPVDGSEVVEHAVTEFERGRVSSGQAIRFRRDAPAPIAADRDALSLAIWNLVDNAFKYSPEPAIVEVDVSRHDDVVRIAVRDHGPGIADDEQTVIFERFRRGSSAATTRAHGTGLGLAIVSHIVQAHHGRIDLDSRPGEGSTFTISLPAAS
jgi:signal transduction histidine kinase